jgi:hypothetical protein
MTSTALSLWLEYAFDLRSNRVSVWRPGRDREGQMNATLRALFNIVFGCAVLCAMAARAQTGLPPEGRPVTAKDICGKKICWNDGRSGLYAANGGFSNDRNPKPHSIWSVPQPGLIKTGAGYRQAEILPNGQFFSNHFCGGCGSITGQGAQWGTVCN